MSIRFRRAAATLIAFLSSAGMTFAQNPFTWSNTGTDWGTVTNWVGGVAPGTLDFPQFTPGTGTTTINPNIAPAATFTVAGAIFGPSPTGGGYTLSGGAGSSLTLSYVAPASNIVNTLIGGLAIRGATTISIPTFAITASPFNTAVEIPSNGSLTLTSGTTLNANTGTAQFVEMRGAGATLTFDNTSAGAVPSLQTPTGQGIRQNGGGTINFLGNAATSSVFTSPLFSAGPGDSFVNVNQPSAGVQTTVAIVSLTRFNTGSSFFFSSTGTGTLGGGGTNPSVTITTNPATSNGVMVQTAAILSPFAFVTSTTGGVTTGTFANYIAANGVVAATTTPRDSAAFPGIGSAPTENTLFQPNSATTTLTAPVTVNTLTIQPTAAGQSLALGANDVVTAAIAYSGNLGFNISSTGGSLFGTGTAAVQRTFAVLDSRAVVSTNANLVAGSVAAVGLNKAGPGFLVLNGTTDQLNFATATARVNITGGVLRGVPGVNIGVNNLISLRGGVLEVDSTGIVGGASLSRTLGTAAGNLNWRAGTSFADAGSGGFSAVGGTLTVSLGGVGTPASVVWGDSTTGGATANFAHGALALIFGSTRSDSTVLWQNPVGLDNNTAGAYGIREIRVTGGTGVSADRTNFAAVISGSSATDLQKTGNGKLELSGANTYAGNTIVSGGTLIASTASPNSATGTGKVIVNNAAILSGSGVVGGALRINAGGLLMPGSPTGTLTVNGAASLAVGSTFAPQISGTTAGSFSQLALGAAGTLDLGGANLSPSATVNGLTGSITLITGPANSILAGTIFAGFPNGSLVAIPNTAGLAYTATINYNYTTSSVVLSGIAPVPEPSLMLLGAACLGGVILRVRRRQCAL